MFRNIADRFATPDDRGVRVFNGLFTKLNTPEDDWGMDIEWPQWIEDVHNTAASHRCFVMGTGPSLTKQADLLPHLANEVTFTVNRMRKFKDTLGFFPTHHVITEPGPVVGFGNHIAPVYDFPEAQNRIAAHWNVVTAPGWLWCPKAPDDIQVRWQGTQGLGERLGPIPTAWGSPFTIVQLALWIGFEEIYMLGVDTTQTGQAWDVERGRTKNPRNVISTLECVDRMRRDIQRSGRVIYDCTPDGRINQEGVLEYRDLEGVLSHTAVHSL